MKKVVLILLFFSGWTARSQVEVFLKDKTKFTADRVVAAPKGDALSCLTLGKPERKLELNQLDSLIDNGQVLKPMLIHKKLRLLSLLSSAKGKSLGLMVQDKIKSRGGYESAIKVYNLYFFEGDRVVEELSFTNSQTDSEVKRRKKFFVHCSKHFAGCPVFLERIGLFRSVQDETFSTILNYLDSPQYQRCK